jgi:hypothetical protein
LRKHQLSVVFYC